MKIPQTKNRGNKKTFLLITLILALVTIPIKENWNSWAIFGFIFAGLIQQPLTESIKRLKTSRYWIFSVIFLIWMALTWFWDSFNPSFIKTIETYGIFLALPIIFTIIPKLTLRYIVVACHLFVMATIAICLVCLVRAYFEYQVTHDQFVFSYHSLSNQVGLNAIYLSNYCVASLCWLLYFQFITPGNKKSVIQNISVLAGGVFLFIIVFLLSSKMLIAIMLLILLFLILYATKFKKLYISIPLIILVCISTVFFAKKLTYLNFRLVVTEFKMYSGTQDDQNGLAARLLMWHSAMELIRERPIQGYGLVGSKELLIKKYEEKDFKLGVTGRYNVHNQYLETLLNSGIIGLLLLLCLVLIPLMAAFREKKVLLIILILHFMLAMLVESALTVQKELVFFWFFIWLFYFHFPSNLQQQPLPASGEDAF